METALQKIRRLLGALESLTDEEHLLLEHGHYAEARTIQDREQPLVAGLIQLLFQPGVSTSLDPAIQQRAQVLINRQGAQAERLSARIVEARASLSQLRQAQGRVQKIRSYGLPQREGTSLSFAGEA